MFFNILYIFLALFGIGFLIFIHELGHYFMARRVGITVEVFAIGFGKSIYEWEHKGVKWKLGWLPFGGYVKMAGTEKKGALEPHQIPDGFFGKRPIDRIKVASMGPIVNIAFSFIAFSTLWFLGGREKSFSEFTQYVGRVEEDSSFYSWGLRAGDKVTEFNGRPFKGFNDFIYGLVLDHQIPEMKGLQIDYFTKEQKPFEMQIPMDAHLKGIEKMVALRSMAPAGFLIFNGNSPLMEASPMAKSGIESSDRIIWVDGELVFSQKNLVDILNQPRVLLTVQRGSNTFLTKIPRLKTTDLRMEPEDRSELDDWQFEAGLNEKIESLYYIPYKLSSNNIVQNEMGYVDELSQIRTKFIGAPRSPIEIPLVAGDRILAVDGVPISSTYEFIQLLQKRNILIIVQKMQKASLISWKDEDKFFETSFDIDGLLKITRSIGTTQQVSVTNGLRLLNPVTPVSLIAFPLPQQKKEALEKQIAEQKKMIEEMKDSPEKISALKGLDDYQKRLMLGIQLNDLAVQYNPNPLVLFGAVFQETWRTFSALITGYLSPKNILGPVGIVQVIHTGWMTGAKEALYWLAMISLNLGILNLLPIPVLDGGHICFAAVEGITKKPIKAKTMERLIIPFIILLIGFFIYLTYHDIARLFQRLF